MEDEPMNYDVASLLQWSRKRIYKEEGKKLVAEAASMTYGESIAKNTSLEVRVVRILYTNYKGETAWRRIAPVCFYFGESQHHQGSQWLLDARDLDKDTDDCFRTFAMKDIKAWEVGNAQPA